MYAAGRGAGAKGVRGWENWRVALCVSCLSGERLRGANAGRPLHAVGWLWRQHWRAPPPFGSAKGKNVERRAQAGGRVWGLGDLPAPVFFQIRWQAQEFWLA